MKQIAIRPTKDETYDEFMNRGMGDDNAQELYPARGDRMHALAAIFTGTEFPEGLREHVVKRVFEAVVMLDATRREILKHPQAKHVRR